MNRDKEFILNVTASYSVVGSLNKKGWYIIYLNLYALDLDTWKRLEELYHMGIYQEDMGGHTGIELSQKERWVQICLYSEYVEGGRDE